MKNGDMAAYPNNHVGFNRGLTKREYFAAKAMQGMLSRPQGTYDTIERTAETAVKYADALLAALEKKL